MFEINKQQFGGFVAVLRKEKGMTQKELAEKLYVSDKAVSKWEVGASIPDVTLLVPLAEELGVTVTELLECRRIKKEDPMDTGRVEELVKTAITYQDDPSVTRGGGNKLPFLIALPVGIVLTVLMRHFGFGGTNLGEMTLLGGIFGTYFWFFAPDRLPKYYDENRITSFGDGPFRMNLVGVAFNSRNWPHIRRVARLWSLFMLAGYPLVQLVLMLGVPGVWARWGEILTLAIVLGGLFIPVIVVGKKYE